jgi:hypothetical protein
MGWDNNPYYKPEAFGLTQVFSIDFSDGCYQFDLLVVWKDADGRLYYAEDSGCSCPSPFENDSMATLTRVQSADEIVSRMEYRHSEMGDWYASDRERVGYEIADFKAKVKRGDV